MEEHSQPKVTLKEKNGVGPYKISKFCVDGSPEPNTQVDVVLIHGLTGDPIKTWGVR